MKVLVCGGRKYGLKDEAARLLMFRVLSGLHERHYFTAIIEGGAPGADASAATFGRMNSIPVMTFKPDWDAYGPAAGPIRNREMLERGKPDLVVAFPGGRGTADMIWQAKEAGVKVIDISDPAEWAKVDERQPPSHLA